MIYESVLLCGDTSHSNETTNLTYDHGAYFDGNICQKPYYKAYIYPHQATNDDITMSCC